jgi:tetratricopeptide (TPR) repeat protein
MPFSNINYVSLLGKRLRREKSLDKYCEKIHQETNGHPILVKFAVFQEGLRNDVEKRYINYLNDRKTQMPDALKIQTALVCSLLDIAGIQISDKSLENMKLKKYAYALRFALLYNQPDGTWKTIHPRWDVELLSFLYKDNSVEEEFLKDAIQSIFSIKDEKIAVTVIASIYDIAGSGFIPIELVESVVEIPSYFAKEKKSEVYTLYIATCYIKLEKFEDAIHKLNEAIELRPHYAHAWYNKGYILYKQEKYDEAITCMDKSVEIDPKDPDSWYNRACFKVKNNQIEAGLTDLRKAIEIGKEEYIGKAKQEADFKTIKDNQYFKELTSHGVSSVTL